MLRQELSSKKWKNIVNTDSEESESIEAISTDKNICAKVNPDLYDDLSARIEDSLDTLSSSWGSPYSCQNSFFFLRGKTEARKWRSQR